MTKILTLSVCSFILVLLAGCDSTKKFLGMENKQPDAFEVMNRAPLELPPDFDLRPPEPGKKRPQEMTKRQQAEQQLIKPTQQTPQPQVSDKALGKTRRSHYKSTSGEQAFLSQAGVGKSSTNLKNKMRQQEMTDSEDSFLKQLAREKKDPVINPYTEPTPKS
ncbi:MAG: hypothetical protein CMM87_02365 [Rickettsiales bacterium]|nr:hypothetical protein [Rickettsiales bacterium]|tara:strand:+ start:6401 stop:6889 length:489 start_codon:yes stop_codon:yes gene_type:complete